MLVTAVSVSTAIAVVVVAVILYSLQKCKKKTLCSRICCVSCESDPNTTSPHRADFIYRDDANCQLDVAVVFIDRNDYQQVYLNNIQGRRIYSAPSAPPPPYQEV